MTTWLKALSFTSLIKLMNTYNFNYRITFAARPGFELKNQLFPFTDFYLHNVLLEEMNDAPKFEFEFSLINCR